MARAVGLNEPASGRDIGKLRVTKGENREGALGHAESTCRGPVERRTPSAQTRSDVRCRDGGVAGSGGGHEQRSDRARRAGRERVADQIVLDRERCQAVGR